MIAATYLAIATFYYGACLGALAFRKQWRTWGPREHALLVALALAWPLVVILFFGARLFFGGRRK